jgi:hypothetical protein
VGGVEEEEGGAICEVVKGGEGSAVMRGRDIECA